MSNAQAALIAAATLYSGLRGAPTVEEDVESLAIQWTSFLDVADEEKAV